MFDSAAANAFFFSALKGEKYQFTASERQNRTHRSRIRDDIRPRFTLRGLRAIVLDDGAELSKGRLETDFPAELI